MVGITCGSYLLSFQFSFLIEWRTRLNCQATQQELCIFKRFFYHKAKVVSVFMDFSINYVRPSNDMATAFDLL